VVSSGGVTIDSGPTPFSKIGIAQHYVDLGTNGATIPRIQAGRQYKIRFHLTSTRAANTQTSFWLYSQTVDFAYASQLQFGGTRIFAGGLAEPNNLTAAQASPGSGTSITTGFYNVMLMSPLDSDIRRDAGSVLLSQSMPQLFAEPGPGSSTVLSFKNIQPGLIMIDTLNWRNPDAIVEVGNVTVDSIQVREYNLVPD
jgi:hypothetical protein